MHVACLLFTVMSGRWAAPVPAPAPSTEVVPTASPPVMAVRSQGRWEGERNGAACTRKHRVAKLAPVGTGERDSPLLQLHVEWRDLHPTR